jgi:hypothetical protein
MNDFYEKHKNLPLSAMFLVFGMKKHEDGTGVIRHSIICHHDALDKTKSDFETVIYVNVYSLYRDSSTSVQTFLNADWSGKYLKPLEPLEQRIGIICEQAVKALDTIYKQHSGSALSSYEIPQFMVKIKKGPKPLAKSIVCKSDQYSLKDAFAMAAKQSEAAQKMEVDQKPEPVKKRPNFFEVKIY